jgi:hypothetical protein
LPELNSPAPKGSIVNELSGVITLGNDEDFREDYMHYLSSLKKVNGLKNDSFSPAHRWKYAL